MKASRLIPVRGHAIEISPRHGPKFTLEELQAYVGGYIELVCYTHDNHLLIVNEEGKLLNLPYNDRATQLFRMNRLTRDVIVGDVVLIAKHQID